MEIAIIDAFKVSIVDIIKSDLVSTPCIVYIRCLSNGNGLVGVALAETENLVLSPWRCTLSRVWFPEDSDAGFVR